VVRPLERSKRRQQGGDVRDRERRFGEEGGYADLLLFGFLDNVKTVSALRFRFYSLE
jgi:hypothetical protein